MMRLLTVIVFGILVVIYLPWIQLTKTLSSGDWPYLFTENIREFGWFPTPPFIWLEAYYQLTAKLGVEIIGLPWNVVEKIFWFYPFLVVSVFSSWIFAQAFFKRYIDKEFLNFVSALSVLIFTTNTYILMIAGGGQMGIAMAYAFSPLVLYLLLSSFVWTSSVISPKRILGIGLISGLQCMLEPRTYILTLIIFLLWWSIGFGIRDVGRRFRLLFIVQLIVIGSNLFWIIPNLATFGGKYQDAKSAVTVGFLSFATFSNTLGLLHPNWPENIFGKIYFMRPEFLLLPLLVFSSLMMTRYKKEVLGLFIIAIIGIFLSKGTNEPFGFVYDIFALIPGFLLFRDPTKFYLLMVITYMLLVPLGLLTISSWLENKTKYKNMVFIFSVVFATYWLCTVYFAVFSHLQGTFRPRDVPKEYMLLQQKIESGSQKKAVLWVPARQRFGFYSKSYPSVNSQDIFGILPPSSLSAQLESSGGRKLLSDESVGYVVIPYDIDGEFFLNDRVYSQKERDVFEKELDALPFLYKEVIGEGRKKITFYTFY